MPVVAVGEAEAGGMTGFLRTTQKIFLSVQEVVAVQVFELRCRILSELLSAVTKARTDSRIRMPAEAEAEAAAGGWTFVHVEPWAPL